MAVYEHSYRQYAGRLTPAWSRFLVIPRHAYRDVFRTKLFVAFYAACYIFPLAAACIIYLHHNVNALALLRIGDVRALVPINASFFHYFTTFQCSLAFFLVLLVGPPLISRDMANNALPLYLCRPFSRVEYVAGKASVIAILLSLVTWVPGLLLFFFQAYLEGVGWLWSNLWIAGSIFLASAIWIVLLSLLALSVSAWVKWRVVASGALLGMFFIPSAFGEIINAMFLTRIGHLFSFGALMNNIWLGLFGLFVPQTGRIQGRITDSMHDNQLVDIRLIEPPLWASWFVIALVCAFCLWLLLRKVRAYEVVK
ncbi:MAG: type transport system permease protein [Acidobacteriota bacterium]|jgi:ABC-2 type transport system permease protein|nr:type transport system permease protein [Acidobacteriota bacterium]